MRHEPQQPRHDCTFEQPTHAVCEDGAVMVSYVCNYTRTKTVTDYESGEIYTVPRGGPCPYSRTVRFDVQTIELDDKSYHSEWEFLPKRVWQAFEALVGVEFSPRHWDDHSAVTACDVGHVPEGRHGEIVLETDTEYGPLTAVFLTEDTDGS